jgi:SOS-response transcriptional repressor LexA
MSVSGILASSTLSQTWQNRQAQAQKVQTEFQQLGRDLQAGSLSQAQSDFSALSQNVSSRLQSNHPLPQTLSFLRSVHHNAGVGSLGSSSSTESTFLQQFSSLGSALQAGNLAAAQAAYATLRQDLAQLGWTAGTASPSTSNTVSILA